MTKKSNSKQNRSRFNNKPCYSDPRWIRENLKTFYMTFPRFIFFIKNEDVKLIRLTYKENAKFPFWYVENKIVLNVEQSNIETPFLPDFARFKKLYGITKNGEYTASNPYDISGTSLKGIWGMSGSATDHTFWIGLPEEYYKLTNKRTEKEKNERKAKVAEVRKNLEDSYVEGVPLGNYCYGYAPRCSKFKNMKEFQEYQHALILKHFEKYLNKSKTELFKYKLFFRGCYQKSCKYLKHFGPGVIECEYLGEKTAVNGDESYNKAIEHFGEEFVHNNCDPIFADGVKICNLNEALYKHDFSYYEDLDDDDWD